MCTDTAEDMYTRDIKILIEMLDIILNDYFDKTGSRMEDAENVLLQMREKYNVQEIKKEA